jgi:methylated-DNA-[protein]-cysteine S-methyltransferase
MAVRAERDGLVDVAFTSVPSPFGDLLVAATRRGLVRLAYPNETVDGVLADLAASVSPRVLEAPGRLDEVRRELEEYFVGERHRFDVPVDWTLVMEGFSRRVLQATARVPFGRVTTYGDVARRAGSPRAARAAGNALGSNPIPIVVPCHRVIRSGGELGGYGGGGPERKAFLLRLEGAVDDIG